MPDDNTESVEKMRLEEKQSVHKRLAAYVDDIEEICYVISSNPRPENNGNSEAQGLLSKLTARMKQDDETMRLTAEAGELNSSEEEYYQPAIHEAYTELSSALESRAGGSWLSNLDGVRGHLTYRLDQLQI